MVKRNLGIGHQFRFHDGRFLSPYALRGNRLIVDRLQAPAAGGACSFMFC